MNATTINIEIGDVVSRRIEVDLAASGRGVRPDVGDVIEKSGDRCRVAWRDITLPNFYRPEEMSVRKGKRTWVNQKALVRAE